MYSAPLFRPAAVASSASRSPHQPLTPVALGTEFRIATRRRVQFVDVTDTVTSFVKRARVDCGVVQLQSCHTTLAVMANEHEPQLLEDFRRLLERWAPRRRRYAHDDLRSRSVNLVPGERANGDAHARALLLGASIAINVHDGRLRLGRWQRLFAVELDGPRRRTLSLVVLGAARTCKHGTPPRLGVFAGGRP